MPLTVNDRDEGPVCFEETENPGDGDRSVVEGGDDPFHLGLHAVDEFRTVSSTDAE